MIRDLALGLFVASVIAAPSPACAQGSATSNRVVSVTLHWIDSTRAEAWTPDTADHRGILVHAYYREGTRERAPLVLLSTGRNVAPKSYTELAESLVKSGYVVGIVDHLGERDGQRLPSGAAVPNLLSRVAPDRGSPEFRLRDSVFSRDWVVLRAADLTSARAYLQSLAATAGNSLSGRLNSQAAAVGHSIGGLTAARACERDASFMACANLDGLSYSLPMHVDGDTMLARQPFLFLGKPVPRLSDEALKRDHMTRAEDDAIVARMEHRFDVLMRSAKGGSYRVIIRNAEHMNFAADGGGAVAKTVRAYLLAFLDANVRGVAGTLLDATPTDAAVTVTRYPPKP